MIDWMDQSQPVRLFVNADHIPRLGNDLIMSVTSDIGVLRILFTYDQFKLAAALNNDRSTT